MGVAGAITIIFSKVKNENLKDLKDRVEILEKEREIARKEHIANQKAIGVLEGRVKIYKDLQLKSIADSNKQILDVLKSSALINAEGAK